MKPTTNLFISNCKFALRLLVVRNKQFHLLHWLRLKDARQKLDILLRVLVAGLFKSVDQAVHQLSGGSHRLGCCLEVQPTFCSGPCAFQPQYLRRNVRNLDRNSQLVNRAASQIFVPPINKVSPVKTTRSLPSSINQQMLSCVWQGVCSALTDIPCPILKVSSCFGVRVTASQSLPPITGMFLNSAS